MDPLVPILTLFAFLTAALSAFTGLGGGTVLIAAFFALGMTPVEAVPLFAAVQFVSNASRTVAYVRHVEWRGAGWFALMAVAATVLVAPYAAGVDVDVVRLILAGLILVSLLPTRHNLAPLPPRASFIVAGLLNGGLGMFVGATGPFTGRLFLRPEWTKETTIATLAFTQVLGHGLRVLAYGAIGYSAFARPELLLPLCVAAILGTWAGKHLNRRISGEQFTGLFKAVLLILSVKLVYDSLRGFGWI
ncbi:sulfite exporter TauE/SafE family protein [Panacagrimonas sp.]|uniref:sulfite exporter TauE/SafE family protein n=1 Tax=Panacagrimonas sp. TaxID=2480088 RepID=UPI003B52D033